MIELANDKNKPSPTGWRSSTSREISNSSPEAKHGRSGATWPFPSRYAVRPVQQDLRSKPAANDSGS